MDDEIYTAFRETFPDMKVDVIDEHEMKSASSKEVDTQFFVCVCFFFFAKHIIVGRLIV